MRAIIYACLAVLVMCLTATPATASEAFNCDACLWAVNKIYSFVGNDTNCADIDTAAATFCSAIPIPVVGPYLCNWLVKKECPNIVSWFEAGQSANHTCERIGFCAGPNSACHSFGKLSDNGRCTEYLANETAADWRLEWNLLPWWKNKGCNPPEHFGYDAVYCSPSHIGCCLSGWTAHAEEHRRRH